MDNLLLRLLIGLGIGLGLGVVFSVCLPQLVAAFTFWSALAILAPSSGIVGVVVAAVTGPTSILTAFAKRIPDHAVFPAFVLFSYLVFGLALYHAPNIIKMWTSKAGYLPTNPHIPMCIVGIIVYFSIYWHFFSRHSVRIAGIRLSEEDCHHLVQLQIDPVARALYVEVLTHKRMIASLVTQYQLSQQAIEDLIAYEQRKALRS